MYIFKDINSRPNSRAVRFIIYYITSVYEKNCYCFIIYYLEIEIYIIKLIFDINLYLYL